MNNNSIDTIKQHAAPIVEQQDLFLVDVEIKHQKVPEVWILVDSEHNGVDVGVCSGISRELSTLFEDKELFQGSYRLNVSSPGLSRPLSDKRQYGKNRGRHAKIKFKTGDEYNTAEGVLENVDDETVTIKADNGSATEVLFSSIVETKIIPKI